MYIYTNLSTSLYNVRLWLVIGCQYTYICGNNLYYFGQIGPELKIVTDGEYNFIYFCVYSMLRFLPASCYWWLPLLDSPSHLDLHLVNLL